MFIQKAKTKVSEQQEHIPPHPRHELHDRIYTGTYAAGLVMQHEAEVHDTLAGYQEQPNLDPGNQIWFLKDGELQDYDDRELYNVASPFTRRIALGTIDAYPGVDYEFKSWLVNDANNAQIINFFQSAFHNLRKTAITSEVERLVEAEVAAYAQQVEAAEAEGWLAGGAAERVNGYKDNPETWRWGTSQMRANPGAEAWTIDHISAENHSYYTPQVVFPAGSMTKYTNFDAEPGVIGRKIKATGFHEFNHAFLGGFDRKWINEAVTEHISRVFHGEVDIEGKGYTDEIAGPYGKEIQLLLTMIHTSQKNVETALSMKDVTLAYSSLDKQAVISISERFKNALGYSFDDTDEYLANKVRYNARRTEHIDNQSDSYIHAIDTLIDKLAA